LWEGIIWWSSFSVRFSPPGAFTSRSWGRIFWDFDDGWLTRDVTPGASAAHGRSGPEGLAATSARCRVGFGEPKSSDQLVGVFNRPSWWMISDWMIHTLIYDYIYNIHILRHIPLGIAMI
jgi:hypothetical protein